MTANLRSAPDVQAPPCTHTSIIPGLDSVQCRNCRRVWPSWHQDFNRLLNQQLTPEQRIDCSGVNQITAFTPEQLTPEQLTPEQPHWVETYSPSNRKNHSYYRYVWMDGQRMHHIHIPGGNTKSDRAISNKTEVERAIALGMWASEIEDLIKSWR